jgi:hypothetical protein
MLWKESAEDKVGGTQRVFTRLIMELSADVEVRLPAFDIKTLAGDEVGAELEQLAPTPLLVVAAIDNVLLARLLLENGAKVQYYGPWSGRFSPLHAAWSVEMVQLLLDHNSDPDFGDENYRGPLHWYAIRKNVAAMRAIL